MPSPGLRRSFTLHPYLPLSACVLAVLAGGSACGGDPPDPCGGLGPLCAADTRIHDLATRVDDALMIDLDGDGEDEAVALTRDAHLLAVGQASGWRSLLWLDATPVALAGLPREIAVAHTDPPGVAVYGLDASGRIEHRRDLSLPADPSALWGGDLDGDGKPELLVAHQSTGELSRLDPNSGAIRTFAAGEAPMALAVADLDGDTRLDVVALDAGAAVNVLRGAGGGEFAPPRAVSTLPSDALAIADHDGDGDLDVVTRAAIGDAIALHRNDGTGALAAPIELPLPTAPTGVGLVAGPAVPGGAGSISVPQGDRLTTWFAGAGGWLGRADEYVFSSNKATWIGRSTPEGLLIGGQGFVAPFAYTREFAPIEFWRDPDGRGGSGALAIGDLDGDGRLDFAAGARRDLHIYRATDSSFTRVAQLSLGDTPRALIIAELTGDARPDILLAYDDRVQLAQATGDDAFELRTAYTPPLPPRALTALRTGPDAPAIVLAHPNGDYGSPPPNLGAVSMRFSEFGLPAEDHVFAEDLTVHRIAAVDLDADGVDEPLLLARRGAKALLTRMTPPGPNYAPGPEHELPVPESDDWFFPTELALGDPDGDGALDAWIRSVGPELWVSGLEDDAPEFVEVSGFAATGFRDIDGDGLDDAVHVSDSGVAAWRGRGDRTFDEKILDDDFPDTTANVISPTVDADFDLISLSSRDVAAHRLRDVVRPASVTDPFAFHGLIAEFKLGDVDRDGHTDIVTRGQGWGGGVAVLRGGPEGLHSRSDGFEEIIDVAGLALGDLDGDGSPEILTSTVSWIDAFRFSPDREELWVDVDPLFSLSIITDLAVADLDGDGWTDLLALAYTNYESIDDMRLYVAYGEGLHALQHPSFTEWTRVLTVPGLEHASLSVGDLDDDGHLDLLVKPSFLKLPTWLILADGPRAWAEPVEVPGQGAIFAPVGDDGRAVDLVVSDGTTIARYVDGTLAQREVLVRDPALANARVRALVDLDVDGHDDLLIETADDTQLWLRRGSSYEPVLSISYDTMTDIAVADIDGDAKPDLIGLSEGRLVVRRTGA